MRRILNIFIQFAIFFVAARYFGEYIVIAGTKETIITTLLWVVSGYAIMGICLLCLVPALAGSVGRIIAAAAMVTVLFLSSPIRLYFLNRWYNGFTINGGFLVYLILSIVLSIFSIGDAKKDN